MDGHFRAAVFGALLTLLLGQGCSQNVDLGSTLGRSQDPEVPDVRDGDGTPNGNAPTGDDCISGVVCSDFSTIYVTPDRAIPFDGIATADISIVLKDVDEVPVQGQKVRLLVSGSSNVVSPSSGEIHTDESGSAAFSLASLASEDKTIDITLVGGDAPILFSREAIGFGVFSPAKEFATSQFVLSKSIVAGHVNDDGRLDLATIADPWGILDTPRVRLGNDLGFPIDVPIDVGYVYPHAVALGDLDKDGFDELITATRDTSSNYELRISYGDNSVGGMALDILYLPSEPSAISVDDVNQDGHLDIIVSMVSGNVNLFLQSPSMTQIKTFSIESLSMGSNPVAVVSGDILGSDGFKDIVAVSKDTNYVSIMKSDGAGGYLPLNAMNASDVSIFVEEPEAMAMGDLNGDGRMDLVIANRTVGERRVTILLQEDSERFSKLTRSLADFSWPRAVGLVDLSGDGLLDIVVVNDTFDSIDTPLPPRISVLIHAPEADDMTYDQRIDMLDVDVATALAIGDFDGDQINDAAITTRRTDGNHQLAIYPGRI